MTNRDIREVFAENLKRLRNVRDETTVDLAEALGVAQSTISDWENAKKMPRAGAIERISEHYNVNKTDLLQEEEQVKETKSEYTVFNLSTKIPLYGDIAAGALATVESTTKENLKYITVPKQFLGKYQNNNGLFAMKVNGDSMNKIIPDGSYVVAKPVEKTEMKNDDIVIFSHDGEYSMKRVWKDEDDRVLVFRPESDSRKFRDIEVPFDTANDLKIYAKVIWYSVTLD